MEKRGAAANAVAPPSSSMRQASELDADRHTVRCRIGEIAAREAEGPEVHTAHEIVAIGEILAPQAQRAFGTTQRDLLNRNLGVDEAAVVALQRFVERHRDVVVEAVLAVLVGIADARRQLGTAPVQREAGIGCDVGGER